MAECNVVVEVVADYIIVVVVVGLSCNVVVVLWY